MADEVEMTPISPEEGGGIPPKVAPFAEKPAAPAAPAPAAAAPATPPAPAAAPAAAAAAPAAAASGSPTIKLKPVIRRPMIRKPTIGGPKPLVPGAAAPAAPAASPAQNLKSATGPIPAQATLRKTGIIAEGIITPAQQQAAKSKTSRISLESAIGVAPAKESPAPMKTIKLRRPAELKPTPLSTSVPSSIGDAPTINPAAPAEQASGEPGPGETQKKTLKLRKPGGPSIGLKKPPTLGVKSDQPAPAPADSAIADIPDLPAGGLAPLAPVPQKDQCAGVPSWVAVMSLVTTLAALLVIGAVAYFLYLEGCGPDAGANAMPFIQTEA